MKEYTITYRLGDGMKKKVVYEANSKQEAKMMAKEENLNVVSIQTNLSFSKIEDFIAGKFPSYTKLGTKILIKFFNQLVFMLEADISLLKAVESMKKGATQKKYRRFLNELHRSILQGNQLSYMMKEKYGFEPEIKLQIQSGEKSGNLSTSIRAILERMEKSENTKNKIAKQMAYPLITVVIMIFVASYILTNVVPGFTGILVENGSELPAITVMLIKVSDFLQAYSLYMLLGAVLVIGTLIFLERRKVTGYYIDKILTRIPLFGPIIINSSLGKYFYVASNMIAGDIPLVSSIEIAAKSVTNKYLKKHLLAFPEEIRKSGAQLDMLAREFSPTHEFSELIGTGLTTGKIEDIFEKIGMETTEKADESVKMMTSMIEPMITVCIGGMVGVLVLSLFMPMFAIMDTL